MIRIQGVIPNNVAVAVSGGPDSMAILDFLRKSGRNVHALFFDHSTKESKIGKNIVLNYCNKHNIVIQIGYPWRTKHNTESQEVFWRTQRYDWLHKILHNMSTINQIITCHHLDDCVEEYIISTIKRGFQGIIPYLRLSILENTVIIRPFRLTLKKDLLRWCELNDIHYISSTGNDLRTKLRQELLPLIRRDLNPGITKMVRKIVEQDYEQKKAQRTGVVVR